MILYDLRRLKNENIEGANGLFFAFPVFTQTYDIDKLVAHMCKHNSPFSAGTLKGILTDATACIRELVLQGIAVKIDNLAIFSIGIKNKAGAATEKEFNVTKNIEGLRLRARGTGDFTSSSLSLEGTLKKASSLTGAYEIPDDDDPSTPSGDDKGGSSSGGENAGSGGSQGGSTPTTPSGGGSDSTGDGSQEFV